MAILNKDLSSLLLLEKKLSDQVVIMIGSILKLCISADPEADFTAVNSTVKSIMDSLLKVSGPNLVRHISLMADHIKSSDYTRCFFFEDFNWLFGSLGKL